MKFDLFTKAILTIIAGLLALNLFTNVEDFSSQKASAAPAGFLEVGKNYSFYSETEPVSNAKIISLEQNGWVKASGYFENQFGTVFINTDRYRIISPIEEKK